MKRLANVLALCVGAFGLLACGGGSGDDTPDAFVVPTIDSGNPDDPDANVGACNPVAQTGCNSGEKCTWIVDVAGTPPDPDLGHTGCVTDGTVAEGDACTLPETGADDCVAGTYCLRSVCTEICSSAPNSCPSGEICSTYENLMEDIENVGLCNPECDPVEQNCAIDTQACYLQLVTGESSCAGIPSDAVGLTQGDDCSANSSGQCYLNGCDKGYGANLPDGPDATSISLCAFFCNPIDNWSGNVQGLTGDPAGIGCTASFGGDRPDGPGPSYECRYLQTFYGIEEVPAAVGMCLDPTIWGGSCEIFDYDQLAIDIGDGTYESETYCDDYPDRCLFDCISLDTANALFAALPIRSNWEHFKATKIKKFWEDRLEALAHM